MKMKKRKQSRKWKVVVLAACLAAALSLSLTACGEETPAPAASSSTASTSSAAASYGGTTLSTGKYSSIQAYLDSPAVKAQLDALKNNLGSSMGSMEIYGDGNRMVYEYYLPSELPINSSTRAQIESAIETQASVFETLVDELETQTTVVNPCVVVYYKNPDGSLVYEKTFSGNGSSSTTSSIVGGYTAPSGGSSTSQGAVFYNSLNDFVNADIVQDQLDSMRDSMSDMGLTFKVFAENNDTLVYEFVSSSLEDSYVSSYIQTQLNSENAQATYGMIASQIGNYCNVVNPKVAVRFINSNGEILAARTFTAN